MGKTTLYHPVSLHVLRGAAEYCGWKLGIIKQLQSDIEAGNANYRVAIVQYPRDLGTWPIKTIKAEFQRCFPKDVHVDDVYLRAKGKIHALLFVKAGADLTYLNRPDLPDDGIPF